MGSLTPRLDKLDKNYIINGNFDYWQRNTTKISPSQYEYVADRWANISASNTSAVIARVASSNIGSSYDHKWTAGTTSTRFAICQPLERPFTLALERAGVATFSIYLKVNSSNARSYTIAIDKNTTPNVLSSGSWSNIASKVVSPTMSYAQYSVTASIPSDGTANGVRVRVYDNSTGLATDEIYMSQAMLNPGTEAPSEFSTPSENGLQGEIALCQRYYEKSYGINTTPGTVTTEDTHAFTMLGSVNNPTSTVYFKVIKRSLPTIIMYNPSNGSINSCYGEIDNVNYSPVGSNPVGVGKMRIYPAATPIVNQHLHFHWIADAELT